LHANETVRSLDPLAVLRSFVGASPGRITSGELSRRLNVGQVRSTAVSYMGFATKGL
jgi:2-polyprenyl-6-hydroxyphenyl methylase/3-demethylubiquinone-9 3-methyltransferase